MTIDQLHELDRLLESAIEHGTQLGVPRAVIGRIVSVRHILPALRSTTFASTEDTTS